MNEERQDNPELESTLPVVEAGQARIVDENADLPDLEDDTEGKLDSAESEPEDAAGEAADTASEADANEHKYAGVFQSVEDLERAYKNLQAEYTRLRQAQKAAGVDAKQATGEQGEGMLGQTDDMLAPLVEEVQRLRYEREWDKLRQEFGDDIQEKVASYFNSLPPSDQEALDNPAGARLIAQIVAGRNKQPRQAKQPVGTTKSHVAPKPKLTRAQIMAMSPEEYAARQPEILEFYASQMKNT